jgi:DNA-binding transcriptional LysR family regulator
MNISYDWYIIFNAAAACGNITEASEQLYISQPAVTRALSSLKRS